MQKKKIRIPIYCADLTVVLDKDLSYVQKRFKTISLEPYGAVTIRDLANYRHYVIALTDKDHLSNIVHEITHLKNMIYLDIVAEVDRINDEHEAYFMGYLFDEIYNFLHKSK